MADSMSVVIVGAGVSGICMGIELLKAGFKDFTILEGSEGVGGTWRVNTYPGCACDVPSVLYSFSFEPFPWTQHYSGQPEILRYVQHCVDKYGLAPHIRLSTRATGATYDESAGTWTVDTSAGDSLTVRALVLAAGGLAIPAKPAIPGLQTFPGAVFHTARWDHSVDLAGKRVAVVGTGASSIQVVPSIQPLVAQLSVWQRTPPWVLPRETATPRWAAVAARCSSWYSRLQRWRWFWFMELIIGRAFTLNKTGIIRQMEKMAKDHLKQQVADPALQAKLTPSYSLGCKRILASDVYYPALQQPNCQLVASAIKEIQGNKLVADDGTTVEADVIILATGFDLLAVYQGLSIKGRGGADLAALAAERPEGYLGLAAHGFPNLFSINGPNSGLGHNSIIFMAECCVNYIVKMLTWMSRRRLLSVEVKADVQEAFNKDVQRRLKGSVWLSGGCRSWYQSDSGRGSFALWPGICVEYWWRTLWPRAADWRVLPAGSQVQAAAEKAKLL